MYHLEDGAQGTLRRVWQHKNGEMSEETRAHIPDADQRDAGCHQGELLNVLCKE